MMSRLLPPAARVAEAYADIVDAALYPEEEQAVAKAVDRRRAEFLTGRTCARRALGELGEASAPVPRGPNREPRWPAGVVGSITHCDGYRAAAVARADDLVSVGIDAEPHAALPEGVLATISLADEREQLRELSRARRDVFWDRLLFSAKESVYKAWYPLAARWLGFEDAQVTVDPKGSFAARLLVPGPRVNGEDIERLSGRWLVTERLVLTAVAVPASGTGDAAGRRGPTVP